MRTHRTETYQFKGYGVGLELLKESGVVDISPREGGSLCKRIALIKPLIKQIADFMSATERESYLELEVNLFLHGKTENDTSARISEAYSFKQKRKPRKRFDPLENFYLRLELVDTNQPGMESFRDINRRSIRIALCNRSLGQVIGHVFTYLDGYYVGGPDMDAAVMP